MSKIVNWLVSKIVKVVMSVRLVKIVKLVSVHFFDL